MKSFHTPALVQSAVSGNLSDLIAERAHLDPLKILLSRPVGASWRPVSAKELDQEIRAAAKGLLHLGIGLGDRVAIMSKTRYEWTILDFAIWYIGGVVVPIYETSSDEQVEWILADSGARVLIVETPALAALAAPVLPKDFLATLIITEGALAELSEIGAYISADEIESRRQHAGPKDLASIIYTSGTTGQPKGVELSHGNFLDECNNIVNAASDLFLAPGGSILLFLPIAHVFGRMIQLGSICAGLHLAHCGDITRLSEDLATFKPTLVLAVPRIFEKVFSAAETKASEGGKTKIFNLAVNTAIAYSKALDANQISFSLRTKHAIYDRLVYSKIRGALGGRVSAAISGGAPLGTHLGHFFRGAGITVLEGYGLTETSAGATLNLTSAHRVGSVGRPIPGTTIAIADDGEILIKGPIIMQGYWKNPAATQEAIDSESYFHSGDLGELDQDGYLFINGRKKELIVTSGGKNVAPAVLEQRVCQHPLISHCVVLGDNQPFIAALITLDPDALRSWAIANKKGVTSAGELAKDPALLDYLQTAIDDANHAVSRAESIRKFVVLHRDFTISGGELTAKLSVKRHVVNQMYHREIESLFKK